MKLEVINEKHDVKSFSCGIEKIDRFLKTRALPECQQLLSKTFVVSDNGIVVAYCTLILHSLKDGEKDLFIDKDKCSEQRVPALLIGQLGVDKKYKGQHIGATLIQKVITYALSMMDYVHFPVIIVDANSLSLVPYYEEKGFIKFKDKGLRLFMPMADIIKTFNEMKWN